jgi:hypothetical protein
MAGSFCTACGAQYPQVKTQCPNCSAVIHQPPQVHTRPAPQKGGMSPILKVTLIVAAVFFSIIFVLPALFGLGSSASRRTETAAPAPAPAQTVRTPEMDQRFEECRATLKQAVALRLLTDMGFDGPRPKFVVSRHWNALDFNAKSELTRTAACFFLTGDSSKSIAFDVRDSMTNRVIAKWRYTELEIVD